MKFHVTLIAFFAAVSFLLPNVTSARDFDPWLISFEAGIDTPTENFNRVVDDDVVYGLNVEYLGLANIGVRVAYNHHKFEYDADVPGDPLEILTFSVAAVASYDFPKWFRVFALLGPCYFSANGQQDLDWGSDEKDIGWNGGAGLEFYPIKNWSVRLQSNYYSAEIGDGTPRASWVDLTAGFAFRF